MKKPSAFTLIELLTVIAIIGILAAIIIPTVGVVRGKAKAVTCASNMRQIGTAMLTYASDNKNHFPYGYGYPLSDGNTVQDTWLVALSPYVGLENRLGKNPLPRAEGVLLCPAYNYDAVARKIPYGYNPNIDPRNDGNRSPRWNYNAIIGTPSRLFLVIETDTSGDFYLSIYGLARRHPGDIANFLFADGHVEAIKSPQPGIYHVDGEGGGGDNRWNFSRNN
ncbi:N-terminal cleavage protein [Opitutaceae bacterium TAV5]|nr:N-terminal cleavage protein [Opitutaceae bacterium TAV5]